MTQEQIIEGNKLIANFMHSKGEVQAYCWYEGNPSTSTYIMYTEHSAKFHKSWDWLMPVVKKIEDMRFTFCITKDASFIRREHDYWETTTTKTGSKIEIVWELVVEFIKWRNQQKHE